MSTRAEKYEYLARIKGFIELYSSKETTNILDGSYRSVYRGRSLDFDDLREYAYGDNVRDVDWKSSSKAGKLLIRRFVAEKKHNVLFVLDSGEKMKADTSAGEDKVQVALDTLGVIAYLVNQAGDDYALMQAGPGGMYFTNFSSGNRHLEEMLREAERNLSSGGEGRPLADVLEYTAENLTRRMVICVITDLAGIAGISEKGKLKAFELTEGIRNASLIAECDIIGRKLMPQMKYANKIGAMFTAVIGDDDIENGIIKIKNMQTGEVSESDFMNFAENFENLIIQSTLSEYEGEDNG